MVTGDSFIGHDADAVAFGLCGDIELSPAAGAAGLFEHGMADQGDAGFLNIQVLLIDGGKPDNGVVGGQRRSIQRDAHRPLKKNDVITRFNPSRGGFGGQSQLLAGAAVWAKPGMAARQISTIGAITPARKPTYPAPSVPCRPQPGGIIARCPKASNSRGSLAFEVASY